MPEIDFTLCPYCEHFDPKNEINGRPICKAYPDGIPQEAIEKKGNPGEEDKPCKNGYKFERFKTA